jgi:hypothetical protein
MSTYSNFRGLRVVCFGNRRAVVQVLIENDRFGGGTITIVGSTAFSHVYTALTQKVAEELGWSGRGVNVEYTGKGHVCMINSETGNGRHYLHQNFNAGPPHRSDDIRTELAEGDQIHTHSEED